jgi:hypothetical protein
VCLPSVNLLALDKVRGRVLWEEPGLYERYDLRTENRCWCAAPVASINVCVRLWMVASTLGVQERARGADVGEGRER